MNEPESNDEAAIVYNRVDRVWMFALINRVPELVGYGLFLAIMFWPSLVNNWLSVVLLSFCVVIIVLSWWPPVKSLRLDQQVTIVRASVPIRTYPALRVTRLKLVLMDSADYDDREGGRVFCSVSMRLWRGPTIRLAVTKKGARILTNWARRHDIPLDGMPLADFTSAETSGQQLEVNANEAGEILARADQHGSEKQCDFRS